MPSNYDITVKKGTTFGLGVTYTDNSTPANPINLTGYTARMQVRPYEGGPLVIELNNTNLGGLTIPTPAMAFSSTQLTVQVQTIS